MSKTAMWVGNVIVCGLLASFLVVDEGHPGNISNILGAMAEATGSLLGGLFIAWIAKGFMKEATDQRKNLASFCGVILFAIATVFTKLFH